MQRYVPRSQMISHTEQDRYDINRSQIKPVEQIRSFQLIQKYGNIKLDDKRAEKNLQMSNFKEQIKEELRMSKQFQISNMSPKRMVASPEKSENIQEESPGTVNRNNLKKEDEQITNEDNRKKNIQEKYKFANSPLNEIPQNYVPISYEKKKYDHLKFDVQKTSQPTNRLDTQEMVRSRSTIQMHPHRSQYENQSRSNLRIKYQKDEILKNFKEEDQKLDEEYRGYKQQYRNHEIKLILNQNLDYVRMNKDKVGRLFDRDLKIYNQAQKAINKASDVQLELNQATFGQIQTNSRIQTSYTPSNRQRRQLFYQLEKNNYR